MPDHPDKDWRVMCPSAAAVCYKDDKKSNVAVDFVNKAAEHAGYDSGEGSLLERANGFVNSNNPPVVKDD